MTNGKRQMSVYITVEEKKILELQQFGTLGYRYNADLWSETGHVIPYSFYSFEVSRL